MKKIEITNDISKMKPNTKILLCAICILREFF